MDKVLLYTLGAEQYAMFMDNYNMSIQKGESEYIHHMRVAMKRLVAIKEYIKGTCIVSSESGVEKIDECVRPIYKASGKVRNLQVALMAISDQIASKSPGDFVEHILVKLQKKKINYLNTAKESSLLSINSFNNGFSRITDQFYIGDENSFLQHLERNKTLAIESISNFLPGKEWHEARRWLKRNYLLIQMFEHALSNELHPGQLVYYRHIEQLLGQWHDLMYLKKLSQKYEVRSEINSTDWIHFKNEIANSMINLEHEIRQAL